jgi:uncharacterized damage-inducible protein DinB
MQIMEPLADVLLESWDRQTQILTNLANLIDESTRGAKPAPEGWPISEHLCHVHEVRTGWLNTIDPKRAKELGEVYSQEGNQWIAITDLAEIKRHLAMSAKAVREAVKELLAAGVEKIGPYDHPVYFLQHMIWHEGYHFGLIILALRNAGKEPTEEWEEANVWGLWRVEGRE